MRKVRDIPSWVKSNPFIVLVGVLTTLFGLIASANNGIPVILKWFNRPDCFTYATVYRTTWSYFKHEGEFWREYPANGGLHSFEFREVDRNPNYIYLLNLTERPDNPNWTTLTVQIPVCGGMAKITAGIPEHWGDLGLVWRG